MLSSHLWTPGKPLSHGLPSLQTSELKTSYFLACCVTFWLNQLFPLLDYTIHTPHHRPSPSTCLALARWVPDPRAVQQLPCWNQCFDWETRLCRRLWSLGTERKEVQGAKWSRTNSCVILQWEIKVCAAQQARSFELDTPITSSKLFSFWQSLFSFYYSGWSCFESLRSQVHHFYRVVFSLFCWSVSRIREALNYLFSYAESSSVKLSCFLVKYLFAKKVNGCTIAQDN